MHPQEDIDGTILCASLHAKNLADNGIKTVLIGGRKQSNPNAMIFEKISSGVLTEYLMDIHTPDIFSRTGLGWRILYTQLDALIHEFSPDILHFHTIMPYGLEFINSLASRRNKRVLTLHNYTPLCANDMCIHTDDGTPCDSIDASQCTRCFPDSAQDVFKNHRRLVLENLEQLDMLTTPGVFAKKLYTSAGVDAGKIRIIRNGTQISSAITNPREEDGVLQLGYIGRNSSIKGLNILLSALLLLPHEIRVEGKIHLSIFGPLDENDSPTFYNALSSEYVQQVFSLLRPLKDNVTLHGSFTNEDLPKLLQKIDCLLIPSIWWEVTPCVIQEAFACKCPVICSNIGGMAEMVTDGVDGLHFEMGNPHDLRDKILALLQDRTHLTKMRNCITPPPTVDCMVKEYIALYHELLNKHIKVA
ncbi:MAG: glycosyltransferase [Azoarcus sp.]|nr:glycosyltransferase [Azoarcus sp.]